MPNRFDFNIEWQNGFTARNVGTVVGGIANYWGINVLTAYGISLEMAIFGAGLNQVGNGRGDIKNPRGWFDDPRDTQMIINGYNAIIK